MEDFQLPAQSFDVLVEGGSQLFGQGNGILIVLTGEQART